MLSLGRDLDMHHGAGRDTFGNDLLGNAAALHDDGTTGLLPVEGEEEVEEVEGGDMEAAEERRLEKRSKDMLRRLRAHTAQQGWGEDGLSLLTMCEGNNKKQVSLWRFKSGICSCCTDP